MLEVLSHIAPPKGGIQEVARVRNMSEHVRFNCHTEVQNTWACVNELPVQGGKQAEKLKQDVFQLLSSFLGQCRNGRMFIQDLFGSDTGCQAETHRIVRVVAICFVLVPHLKERLPEMPKLTSFAFEAWKLLIRPIRIDEHSLQELSRA